jgi:hypothetical protein
VRCASGRAALLTLRTRLKAVGALAVVRGGLLLGSFFSCASHSVAGCLDVQRLGFGHLASICLSWFAGFGAWDSDCFTFTRPNPSFNRTYTGVPTPGYHFILPGYVTLAYAG